MDPNTFHTKGNLTLAKNSLALSRQGFGLLKSRISGTEGNIDLRLDILGLLDQFHHFPDQNQKRHGYGNPACRI